MANILAIETSSDALSVSLKFEDEEYHFHEIAPRQHTERLLGVIEKILNDAKANLKDLDAIGVGCGPGSFTGIRLACSIAQGLAFSSDLKTIQVSSLEVLAEGIQRFFNKKLTRVLSLVDCGRDKIYAGNFSYIDEKIVNSKLEIVDLSNFRSWYPFYDLNPTETFFLTGRVDIVEEYRLISSPHILYKTLVHQTNEFKLPRAEDLLNICIERFNSSEVLNPSELLPIYLSDEAQWKKLK